MSFNIDKSLLPYERLFIALVKLAIRQRDKKFIFYKDNLEYIANLCGVKINCDLIRDKVRKELKEK